MNGFICYCFEYTREDIEQDVVKNGRSLILEKMPTEKKFGGCQCADREHFRAGDALVQELATSMEKLL